MRPGSVISAFLLVAVLLSCGKGQVSDSVAPQLTVLIGTDGYGDGSYNDTMLSGILGFCKDHPDVKLSLQQPESIADAGKRLDAWLSEEGSADRALILASNTYEDILRGKPAPINGRLLILATDDVFPGHSSYIIRRYGASWLCGAMSRFFTGVIFKAMDGNDMIEESAKGFSDGHRAASDKKVYTWTLADGPEGFAMRDSTYRFVYRKMQESYTLGDDFTEPLFFPLLGGSLPGLFDYSRYNGFIDIAGMDVDCTVYNPFIVPYSLCVNNHIALKMYLEDWLAGESWPEHREFGLESEYVQVVPNPKFNFANQDMPALYEEFYSRAVEIEKAYGKE